MISDLFYCVFLSVHLALYWSVCLIDGYHYHFLSASYLSMSVKLCECLNESYRAKPKSVTTYSYSTCLQTFILVHLDCCLIKNSEWQRRRVLFTCARNGTVTVCQHYSNVSHSYGNDSMYINYRWSEIFVSCCIICHFTAVCVHFCAMTCLWVLISQSK